MNQIKFNEKVKEHIFQKKIWLKLDMFETKVESSPVVMLMLHPRLANRNQLTEDMELIMQETVQKLQLCHTENCNEMDDTRINKTGKPRSTSQFYLEMSIKKWRDLNVEVIRINCVEEDAEFIKYLLSSSGEHGSLQKGVFLLEGLHLMERKELVYNMLYEHESYTKELTGIPVSGIGYKDLETEIPGKQKSVKDIIMNIPGVVSIEKKTRTRPIEQYASDHKNKPRTIGVGETGKTNGRFLPMPKRSN